MLRMATAPPIARDRLIGLANVSTSLINNMEKNNRIPPNMDAHELDMQLTRIGEIIYKLADGDIFTWLGSDTTPEESEIRRAATVVADRLTGAVANPLIRNAQEQRQLDKIHSWLIARGYKDRTGEKNLSHETLDPASFAFRLNVPINQAGRNKKVNIPVDVVVQAKTASSNDFPLLIEAKSAGDFTNTNKRRKEEATKIIQLRSTYGNDVRFILYLCGYFDSGYLGYEAAEGIDWVWEHRTDDLEKFGL